MTPSPSELQGLADRVTGEAGVREKVARIVLAFQYGDSMAQRLEENRARGWFRALYSADEVIAMLAAIGKEEE